MELCPSSLVEPSAGLVSSQRRGILRASSSLSAEGMLAPDVARSTTRGRCGGQSLRRYAVHCSVHCLAHRVRRGQRLQDFLNSGDSLKILLETSSSPPPPPPWHSISLQPPSRCQRSLDAYIDSLAERTFFRPAIANRPRNPPPKLPSTDLLALPCSPPDTQNCPLIRACMHLGRRLRCARTAETALSCAPPARLLRPNLSCSRGWLSSCLSVCLSWLRSLLLLCSSLAPPLWKVRGHHPSRRRP
jgi:hypothetical protein